MVPNPKSKFESVPIHVPVPVPVPIHVPIPDHVHVPDPLPVLVPEAKVDRGMPSTGTTCKLNVNLILEEHKGSIRGCNIITRTCILIRGRDRFYH